MDSVEIFAHPPFSPDEAPSDYGLFCPVTNFLYDQQFNTFDEAGEACLHFLWFQASELVSGTDSDAGWSLAENHWEWQTLVWRINVGVAS